MIRRTNFSVNLHNLKLICSVCSLFGANNLLCSRRKILIQRRPWSKSDKKNMQIYMLLSHYSGSSFFSSVDAMSISFIDKIVTHLEENYKRYPHTSLSWRKFCIIYALITHIWIKWYPTDSHPSRLWSVCCVLNFPAFYLNAHAFTCAVEVIWKRNNHGVNMKGCKCAENK